MIVSVSKKNDCFSLYHEIFIYMSILHIFTVSWNSFFLPWNIFILVTALTYIHCFMELFFLLFWNRALYHEILLEGPLINSVIGLDLRSEFDNEITNANAKHKRSGLSWCVFSKKWLFWGFKYHLICKMGLELWSFS